MKTGAATNKHQPIQTISSCSSAGELVTAQPRCTRWQENATVGKKMQMLAKKFNCRILDDSGIVRGEDCKATAAPAAYPSGTDFTELHKMPFDSPTFEAPELVSTHELSDCPG